MSLGSIVQSPTTILDQLPTTVLGKYELLPNLRDEFEKSTGKLRTRIKRAISTLLKKEPVIENIMESLDRQRVARESMDVTHDIGELDAHARHKHIAELPHTIINFVQRAFCLPEDYRLKKDGASNEQFIVSLVFQPEFISDDFMIGFGFMNESERKAPYQEKIQMKINAIPAIKELFCSIVMMSLGPSRDTGRIGFVGDRKSPNFGKYVMFQETTDIDTDKDHKKRKKVRQVIPHIYDDHYSLMRGQRYAITSLDKKIVFLSNLRDTIVPDMLFKFASQTPEEKKNSVAIVAQELKGKLSYNERRALQDRLEKITFKHVGNDQLRLIGACNDIIKELQEKIGKNKSISLQFQWLKEGEKSNRIGFESFYRDLTGTLDKSAGIFAGLNPMEMSPDNALEGIHARTLLNLWKIAEIYHVSLNNTALLGNPFSDIHNTLSYYVNQFHQHRDRRGKNGITLEGIRITLAFILAIKKIRYQMLKSEIQHYKKIRGDALSYDEKRKIASKIESVLYSFQHSRFLPNVQLKEKAVDEFESMIGELEKALLELGA